MCDAEVRLWRTVDDCTLPLVHCTSVSLFFAMRLPRLGVFSSLRVEHRDVTMKHHK